MGEWILGGMICVRNDGNKIAVYLFCIFTLSKKIQILQSQIVFSTLGQKESDR